MNYFSQIRGDHRQQSITLPQQLCRALNFRPGILVLIRVLDKQDLMVHILTSEEVEKVTSLSEPEKIIDYGK